MAPAALPFVLVCVQMPLVLFERLLRPRNYGIYIYYTSIFFLLLVRHVSWWKGPWMGSGEAWSKAALVRFETRRGFHSLAVRMRRAAGPGMHQQELGVMTSAHISTGTDSHTRMLRRSR